MNLEVKSFNGRRPMPAEPQASPPTRRRSRIRRWPETTAQRPYERSRDLAKLIPMWPHELADGSLLAHRKLVELLKTALKGERHRGASGHWTYDLTRHARLAVAYASEKESLEERERAHNGAGASRWGRRQNSRSA